MHSVVSMFVCHYPKKKEKKTFRTSHYCYFFGFVVDKKHYLPILSACTEYDMNTLFLNIKIFQSLIASNHVISAFHDMHGMEKCSHVPFFQTYITCMGRFLEFLWILTEKINHRENMQEVKLLYNITFLLQVCWKG